MSVRTMARVWEVSKHAGSELLMLLAIADFADDDGRAYPAVQTLASKCRILPRGAQKLIAALRQSGELQVCQNEGPKGTNLYRITLLSAGVQRDRGVQQDRVSVGTRGDVQQDAKPLSARTYEPSMNHQEPSKVARKRAAAFDADAVELPDWLPRPIWADWVADRRERRKPISSRAAAGQLKRLAELRNEGHEPEAVIGNSIANGYQGLFAPPAEHRPHRGAASASPVLAADDVFTGAGA